MKSLFVLSMSLFAINSFAFSVDVQTKCGAPVGDSSISAGTDGAINRINSLGFKINESGLKDVKLNVSGVTAIDSANNDNASKISNEVYKVKNAKSGTMFELEGSEKNTFSFDAVFLELGETDVLTAGPIPEGTYDQVVSLGIIDSNVYYKNASPMTVKKFVFKCKTTYKYN
jgi:hypothetical protein